MSFECLNIIKDAISKIVDGIKELDVEVNDYKKVVQNPYIPSVAYVNWAVHLAESGQFEEAEEKLVASTLMAHQTPEAYINLGLLKTKEKDYDAAMSYYIKAIRLDKNSAKAYCFLGNTLTEMRDYKDAEKKFKYANKIDPNNSDVLLNWGLSLLRQRKMQQAKEKFQQACKLNISNFMALYFWGIVELEMEEYEKAREKFKIIVSALPNHHEALYYLAYLDFKENNYNESLYYAEKSLEINPKKIETYMLVAENYMNMDKESECLKYYEIGQKEAQISYYFLISWGASLQKFKRYEESKAKIEGAIKMDPQNDLGYAYLGVSLFKLEDYDAAVEIFNKTLELNTKNIVAFDNLGQISFDRKDYKNAIKYFELVLKNSAKAVKNYHKIANAYNLDKNTEKAREYFEKASEYQPDEINVYIDYAKFLIEQKDYKLAMRKIRNACKLDDKNVDCLNILFYLNYLLAKENLYDYNVEEAMKIAKKIEENYPDSFGYADEKEELLSILNSKK